MPFLEENASHVVIDRASGQALFALCGHGHSQGLLVESEPFVEAATILVKNAEIVKCLRGLSRCLAEFADSESHRFLQFVFGTHVIALQASKLIRLKTLARLGQLRRLRGDYVRAENELQEAVRLAVGEFGETSGESAQALNDLGVLHKYCGRFDEGLRLYKEALRVTMATQGEECLTACTIYHNMGGILFSKGDFAAAKPYGEKAWELSQRLLGESDPRTMADAAAFAAILDGFGRYDESEAIYRRALAVFEECFGPVHYEVAATLHNLAAVLVTKRNYQEAEENYRRALSIKERLLGADSPDVALTCSNLGSLLTVLGRRSESVPLLKSAIAILENRLTPAHPELALARENLRKALS